VESGGNLKNAAAHANVINPSLVQEADDMLVMDQFPPPELHLLIGVVNRLMDVLIHILGLD
jgi:hypothetical protein